MCTPKDFDTATATHPRPVFSTRGLACLHSISPLPRIWKRAGEVSARPAERRANSKLRFGKLGFWDNVERVNKEPIIGSDLGTTSSCAAHSLTSRSTSGRAVHRSGLIAPGSPWDRSADAGRDPANSATPRARIAVCRASEIPARTVHVSN